MRILLQTLTRNRQDAGVILDEFEATHDDYELSQSRHYHALGAAHYYMGKAIDKINNEINK